MPTHAAPRRMIAAIQVIKDRNQNISDLNQRDWVSIITFDSPLPMAARDPGAVDQQLRYRHEGLHAAPGVQRQLASTTATEIGPDHGHNHIKPQNQGGSGRTRPTRSWCC